jgi:Ferritin-like
VENRIFPRNLTARASYPVPGNPVVTRPEAAVANCFPGLELDVRNLDRRFFPGLVFNFVEAAGATVPGKRYGAVLAYVDQAEDPDLRPGEPETEALYKEMKSAFGFDRQVAIDLYDGLGGKKGDALSEGEWYLDWIEQGKPRLSTNGLMGLAVWRLVRGLEPGPVTICLRRHHNKSTKPKKGSAKGGRGKKPKTMVLKGWRRLYTNPVTGVINGAYQPGELMQGLCSPWQHDFRDCACHYWASNHPDLVLPEPYPGELLPGGEAYDPVLNNGVDWLRADRSREMSAAASDTIPKNRPFQFDHFQINSTWQQLSIVLENREISAVYMPEVMDTANPFSSVTELKKVVREWLAPLEMTLALEYLFAFFSLRNPGEITDDPALSGALMFVREHLLLIAANEMQHLRWANELLWGVSPKETFVPVLVPSVLVPTGAGDVRPKKEALNFKNFGVVHKFMRPARKIGFDPAHYDRPTSFEDLEDRDPQAAANFRPRELRKLCPEVQEDYIVVEHERGFIDSTYARVVATLRQAEYPDHLIQLPLRILSDGMRHESDFIHIKAALDPWKLDTKKYLRDVKLEDPPSPDTQAALTLIKEIVAALEEAYTRAGNDALAYSSGPIAKARTKMSELLDKGEALAAGRNSIGIPFFRQFEPEAKEAADR